MIVERRGRRAGKDLLVPAVDSVESRPFSLAKA